MMKHEKISISLATILSMFTLLLLTYSTSLNATTYYVATNGTSTAPYDAWAKAATSIQTAINAASDDDIIIVGSSDGHGTGIYTENVIVNKPLTIQSENGFNTTTIVAASSSVHGFVTLTVYNSLGQKISTLVNKHQINCKYSVQFDASSAGSGLPSGVYFYEIVSGSFNTINKMLLLR